MHRYTPILIFEVRGREVGEDSNGRVSESVILRTVWECLLSPFSFPSSSAREEPLKLQTEGTESALLILKVSVYQSYLTGLKI